MRVLVVYASKYGATQGIAERIAKVLQESGHQAASVPASRAGALEGYDGFVVGSAVYEFSWMNAAKSFLRKNAAALSAKPTWLFSSGPLGASTTDAQGRNVRESAAPKDIEQLEALVKARGHRVFFGAFDHTKLNLGDGLIYALPPVKKIFTEGDYRDWDDVETWARTIARELEPSRV